MKNIRVIRRKVMIIANRLKKLGSTMSKALKLAWSIIKRGSLLTAVAGVTFGKRQTALDHLKRYNKNQISIQLVRERKNQFDSNAVAVWVRVENKGIYKMGYLNRQVAKAVSILLDKGYEIAARFEAVTGGDIADIKLAYGMNISLIVV